MDTDQEVVLRELGEAPRVYRGLVAAATPELLRRRTNGTRWTNRELLFHLLLAYGLVRVLLPLVAVMDRLPAPVGRGFSGLLNAGSVPFHAVNYVGAVVGGRLLPVRRMPALFDHTCAALARRLRAQSRSQLSRGMPFPTRWDPFFTDRMTVLDVFHYPMQHLEFHSRQLTLD